MKPVERIGNWKIYKMNGEFVAIDNRGKYVKFASMQEAVTFAHGA